MKELARFCGTKPKLTNANYTFHEALELIFTDHSNPPAFLAFPLNELKQSFEEIVGSDIATAVLNNEQLKIATKYWGLTERTGQFGEPSFHNCAVWYIGDRPTGLVSFHLPTSSDLASWGCFFFFFCISSSSPKAYICFLWHHTRHEILDYGAKNESNSDQKAQSKSCAR
jgi:hypothetical protein